MGRAKIALEPINNHKKRKITFNTRKQGLLKKDRELSTLCDVNVSLIICDDDQQTPQIFPPDSQQLHSLIHLYQRNDQQRPGRLNLYDLSNFYMDRKKKIEEDLVKAKKKNLEAKYPLWFDFLDDFSETELRQFALWLEKKIVDVKSRFYESVNKVDYNNFVLDPVGLENNLIMQSHPNSVNPIMMPSSSPDSTLNMMLNEDDPLGFYGVENNVIMRSSNPIVMPSTYPDSLMNMMLYNDGDVVYNGASSGPQPSLMVMDPCFQPELVQQFLVSGFPEQVKSTRASGTGIFNYLL